MKNISYCVYHNPMCSKSRQSLELLNQRTNNFYIIEYLKVKINDQAFKKSIQCLVLPYYDIIRDQNIRQTQHCGSGAMVARDTPNVKVPGSSPGFRLLPPAT